MFLILSEKAFSDRFCGLSFILTLIALINIKQVGIAMVGVLSLLAVTMVLSDKRLRSMESYLTIAGAIFLSMGSLLLTDIKPPAVAGETNISGSV